MGKSNERYVELKFDGSNRHIKSGDKFILPNRRRTTFIRSLFGALPPFLGMHFATPPTEIKNQFNSKIKIWFVNFNLTPENGERLCEKINESQDVITRFLLGTNYNAVQKYDIKPIDETFMVFDPHNDYQFKGVFKPKEWETSEEIFFSQEFVKIANDIKFAPIYNKK